MSTRKKFIETVKKFNATFEQYNNVETVEFCIDAPDGYYWKEGDSSCICGNHHKHFPPISNCYADMIERMNYGTEAADF